ncbi:hypothetical protein ACFLUU_07440 [Chloroflexota bacterium]
MIDETNLQEEMKWLYDNHAKAAVGVAPPAPFTLIEDIAWAILTVPVVILGIMVIKRSE